MPRLFFALQPDADVCAALAAQVAPLAARLNAQRVPAENLHATLCFLGAVDAEKLPLLESVAAQVRGVPATLRFDRLEYWRKPRVLVATSSDDAAYAPATALAAELARTLLAAGFTPDVKPFRPHLTLARKVDARHVEDCDWPLMLAPAAVVNSDHFVLMESRSGSAGSIYSVVKSWPLYVEDRDWGSANIQ
jgi:2'-5' RNA ligase